MSDAQNSMDNAIWHYMDAATVAGYGPWVRHVDHQAALDPCDALIEQLVAALDRITKIDKVIRNLGTEEQTDADGPCAEIASTALTAAKAAGYGGEP